MKKDLKSKAKAPAAKRAPKSTAKSAKAEVKSKKAGTNTVAASAVRAGAGVKAARSKTRSKKLGPAGGVADDRAGKPSVDPIGDTTDGEGRTYTGDADSPA